MRAKYFVSWLMQWAGWVVVGLLGVTGCQSNTTIKAETKVAKKLAAPAPAPSVAPEGVGAPFVGYHRYRGTVGGRPVLLELTVDSTTDFRRKGLRCEGSYFYERLTGGTLALKTAGPYQPGQPLRLVEDPTGTWQAEQPLGPGLTGTWTSRTGRRLPFALREDYQGAVRYEMLATTARGHACPPDPEMPTQYAAWSPFAELTHSYLHLLGPDTLRPALRRLQCPVPARRRALVRAEARTDDHDCTLVEQDVRVWLNAYGLLSVSEGEYVNEYNGSRPHAESRPVLYDLRTGRPLTLAEVLRPGADTLLERLAAHQLRREQAKIAETSPCRPLDGADRVAISLPRNGVLFDCQGILLAYYPGELGSGDCDSSDLSIPYPELLPLLRPDSPVARMLCERGLWRGGRGRR